MSVKLKITSKRLILPSHLLSQHPCSISLPLPAITLLPLPKGSSILLYLLSKHNCHKLTDKYGNPPRPRQRPQQPQPPAPPKTTCRNAVIKRSNPFLAKPKNLSCKRKETKSYKHDWLRNKERKISGIAVNIQRNSHHQHRPPRQPAQQQQW